MCKCITWDPGEGGVLAVFGVRIGLGYRGRSKLQDPESISTLLRGNSGWYTLIALISNCPTASEYKGIGA